MVGYITRTGAESAAKSTQRAGGMCVVWVGAYGRWEEKGRPQEE